MRAIFELTRVQFYRPSDLPSLFSALFQFTKEMNPKTERKDCFVRLILETLPWVCDVEIKFVYF